MGIWQLDAVMFEGGVPVQQLGTELVTRDAREWMGHELDVSSALERAGRRLSAQVDAVCARIDSSEVL